MCLYDLRGHLAILEVRWGCNFGHLTVRVRLYYLSICSLPEPLGGVRNLQVLNPTMTTLNVRWEPAEGKVKEYKVVYVPAAGGAETMVGLVGLSAFHCC